MSLRIQKDWDDDYASEGSLAYTGLKNRTEAQMSKKLWCKFNCNIDVIRNV